MVIKKKSRKESALKKILKAPLRILARAWDFYMKGMAEYSDQVCVVSCPTGNFNSMPRSYSVSSTKPNHLEDDLREPLRAASTRSDIGSINKKINVDVPARQQYSHKKSATRLGDNMPRSRTVAIGRIDEEKPCDFDEEDVKVKTNVYPRSRSYDVSKSTYHAALTQTQPVVDPEGQSHLDVVQNRQTFLTHLHQQRLKSSIVETAVQDQTLKSPAQATCDQDLRLE
ncbi:hypothetical protein NC653_032073 [Populus alba x Populus x berolinensis]|uniref:Uncharacterized protein n=2 Tax=Populus TaxID=3689 RepID=A0A4U5N866_POPAL|nr:hypothetical protein NC653_032073 [Populus alba x Populus x berolinensis]TKR78968.1 hypothetical protein D5086_0000278680 [Populus alba]